MSDGNVVPNHCFSTEDYHRMADVGILASDARVELLDGHVIDMLPISPFHANSTRRLNRFFARLGEDRWFVDMQNPVRLNGLSEPQPDIVLLRPLDEEYAHRHPTPADVLLLVEVAERSIRYDRGRKLAAYARAEIQEYWIVNLTDRLVEVYRQPLSSGQYASVERRQGTDTIAPAAFPDVAVTVADLLKA